MQTKLHKLSKKVKSKFLSSTLNFVFIVGFISLFQVVFGAENSIVGVIFAVMMSASMVRDMTGAPLRHLVFQAAILVGMGIAAYLVSTLNPWLALPINFLALFFLLYTFTYEYANHMYFPYILSYLFLVFISPVEVDQLPVRLLGLLAGAVCIIFYQLFMGRKRAAVTAQTVLGSLLDIASRDVAFLQEGKPRPEVEQTQIRNHVIALSRAIHDRRTRPFRISDASFCLIDAGCGLEDFILFIHSHWRDISDACPAWLGNAHFFLERSVAYVHGASNTLPKLDEMIFAPTGEDPIADEVFRRLSSIRSCLLHMSDPIRQSHIRPTVQSLKTRLRATLDLSAVRVLYAFRTSLLLATATLVCQLLNLTNGKWLLFTLASLSLPYADDVVSKTRKRILATILGGLLSVAVYTLIPSSAGRTIVMMLAGYISMYLADYTGTYTCSTIGALGGAIYTSAFSLSEVGGVFIIRVGYICLGAILAWFFNCVFLPFQRGVATRLLLKKYNDVTQIITWICQSEHFDLQLYYDLVIQSHLMEDKLIQNASEGGEESDVEAVLHAGRQRVRCAQRHNVCLCSLPL